MLVIVSCNVQSSPSKSNILPYHSFPNSQLSLLVQQDDSHAKYELGTRLCCGAKTHQDNARGYMLICEAAKDGLPQAQYRLAEIHQAGVSFSLSAYDLKPFLIPQDKAMAYMWYSLAAESEYSNAQRKKSSLHDELSITELNRAISARKSWRRTECSEFGKSNEFQGIDE